MDSRKRSIISNDEDMSPLYKDWDEASCPICMDHPHNAILLICSSHNNGCRSYICDTSYRHSNCLDRFKKLKEENSDDSSSTNLNPGSPHVSVDDSNGNSDLSERLDSGETNTDDKSEEWSNLKCPLCRGAVLGWKVIDEARKYLNLKSRTCSRESCSFAGNYRELRRHARRVHPTVRPADVDPSRQRAWRRLEDQREYGDIVTAVRSAVPGSVVVGDYMIESGDRLSGEREGGNSRWLSALVLFQMIGSLDGVGGGGGGGEVRGGRSRGLQRFRHGGGSFTRRRYLWGENLLGLQNDDEEEDEDDDEDDDDEVDLNVLSDIGPPRRRRRLMRAPPNIGDGQ